MNQSKRRSVRQERRVADDIGGRVQSGSGAPDFCKGDARAVLDVRVECKTTSKSTYSLKVADVLKIATEALMGGAEDWVMQIEFQGSLGMSKRFAVLDHASFLDMKKQGYPDKILYQTSEETTDKSYKLRVDHLMRELGFAASGAGNRGCWCLALKFANPPRKLAIIDWLDYLELRERKK